MGKNLTVNHPGFTDSCNSVLTLRVLSAVMLSARWTMGVDEVGGVLYTGERKGRECKVHVPHSLSM